MHDDKRIRAICKVIIVRALGFFACIVALVTSYRSLHLYVAFTFDFIFILYDVLRLKWQIDKTVK